MDLITQPEERFIANSHRHIDVQWEQVVPLFTEQVLARIEAMENTGGEPDVMLYDHALYYVDFAPESPVERRNLCYDSEAFASRKRVRFNR